MCITAYGILAAIMTTGITFGQVLSHSQVKVVTVCEVLGGGNRYPDTAGAVVGRMERSVSAIDHYEFLSQDHCDYSITAHGHTWPNKIQVWTDREKGMPKPPRSKPTLPSEVVAAKLSVVLKTTELGWHEVTQFNGHGRQTTVMASNEWAVVYGWIVKSPRIDEDCGDGGCGGDDVPFMIIADPSEVHILSSDGRPLPKEY